MNKQRSGGMTAIGILNIIFGSLGSLGSLVMILGGGLLAAGGSAMEAQMGPDAEGFGEFAATGGAIFMAIGVAGLLTWVALLVSGVGVLKLAAWGRKLAMICGGVMALLGGVSVVANGFGLGNLGMFVYGVLLIGLFLKPQWKAAFTPASSGAGDGTEDAQASPNFRTAA